MSRRLHLVILLGVALALRLLVWQVLPYRGFISDEAEYLGAAIWLAEGRGFSFFDAWIWTRPPLYVLFLAIHVLFFGPTALWAPRLTQALLGVLVVYLVVRLGEALAGSSKVQAEDVEREAREAECKTRAGLIAGWMTALSYTFISFPYLLLSETFFLLLFLLALLALLRWAGQDSSAGSTRGPSRLLAYRWLIAGGVLLGLCALTKALVLTWLPFVALWVLWTAGGRSSAPARERRVFNRAGWPAAAILTIAVCAVVLPWSAYATARWGQGDGFILVDTTGGYNFALGAQTGYLGRRDEKALHDELCDGALCDMAQARRQREAYALGWRWINERPAGFLRKTGAELLDMIQLRYGGAERLNKGYAFGEVPLPHLLGLLADDTLYILVLPLAIAGLLRFQGRRGKGLVVSWLLYNIVVGALIFAINRFRVPLLPFLFIYAAIALTQRSEPWISPQRRRAALALAVSALIIVLPSYLYWPPFLEQGRRSTLHDTFYALRGLRDRAACDAAEAALRRGELELARQLHDQISARKPLPCLAPIQARLLEAEGHIDGDGGALAFLARAAPPGDVVQAAKILMLEGDLLRRLGREQEAIERFVARQVEVMDDHDWAWASLRPPPARRIDLGAGLDYGYLRGFYQREGRAEDPGNFRWSGPEAVMRFPGAGTGGEQRLVMRVSGYTIRSQPTAIAVWMEGKLLRTFVLKQGWQEIEVRLPPVPPGADVVVSFTSPVFVNPRDLAERVRASNPRPLRFLGFQVDWAELRSP
ncbi:MAG: hypothetical protein KatS3mg057_1688 [Herpetosiphonaceae bacterium]|nr:MAG: hypothetical protein KatS3mg057_1688 [Herpetosiphonaceae bacterium]